MEQELAIEYVQVDSLKLDPNNAREHSEKNVAMIRDSYERFGQRKPIVTWHDTVIDGNGQLMACYELGWKKIAIAPCPDDWTYEQATAYALAANRTAETATWDEQKLLDNILSLKDPTGTGFGEKDVEALRAILNAQEPPIKDLDDAINDAVAASWPLISVKVPPELYRMFKEIPADNDQQRIEALMGTYGPPE